MHDSIVCVSLFTSKCFTLINTEILDELGVTPAHFAAQGGHLDCILV